MVKAHTIGKGLKMKQLFGLLLVTLLSGLWLSLKGAQCQILPTRVPRPYMPYCYNTSSGKTCFTTLLVNNSRTARKPFEEASHWCKTYVPGSSLIVINSLEIQRAFEGFIVRQVLEYEAIIMDAQMLSANESQKWSWVNGQPYSPNVSKDISRRSERFHDGACVESKSRNSKSANYCFGNVTSLFRYICELSGAALTYTNWKNGFPEESSNKQCICFSPKCRREKENTPTCEADDDRKWRTCNCNHNNYTVVCQKEEILSSSSADGGSSVSFSSYDTTKLHRSSPWPEIDRKIASTSSMIQEPSNNVYEHQTTVFASSSPEFFISFTITQLLLILLLFVTVVFIVCVVILVIRKYKKRNERSSMKEEEAVSPEYETMVRNKRPADDAVPIYTELELTERPKPSNSSIYANVQPTGEAVDMDVSVVYVDPHEI